MSNTYRVFGSRTQEFYVDVEAADPDEAYDIANQDDVEWIDAEIYEAVEPHTVELYDSPETGDLQLNKDEWPEMESGILITGTN